MESSLQKLVMVITQPLSNNTFNWIVKLIKEEREKPQEIWEVTYNWLSSDSQTGSNQRPGDMVGLCKPITTILNEMSFTEHHHFLHNLQKVIFTPHSYTNDKKANHSSE